MGMSFSQRDQASRLRQMVAGDSAVRPAETPSGCHIVSVLSGKGGVGKTFLSTNLSLAMAARGHRVILFDMDMGLANADIVLGVEAKGTWSEVLKGRRRLEDVVIEAPGGLAFVPGTSGIAELADLSEFERHQLMLAMQQIESRYDLVVLDCGAGISRNVLSFAATADTMLVVTTPEPTSLTDAYATIKVIPQLSGGPGPTETAGGIGLVVNNVTHRREAREVYERISSVAARFLHLPVADYGYILRDEYVSTAIRERSPLVLRYPRSYAAGCLSTIAEKLSREIGEPQAERGLFYRFVNLFR